MKNQHTTLRQAGFTLAEIMVGLAIGMLATLVILQVFSVFETQKRATTGTADAQTNGSIALYTLGREMQLAGYGLIPFGVTGTLDSAIECSALTIDGVVDATTPNRLTPLAITDATSDTITIRYGSSLGGGNPTPILTDLVGNEASVESAMGCQKNDRTLIYVGASCAMSTATAVSVSAVPPTILLQNTSVAVSKAKLACLGTWNEVTYRVNGGNLERCELTTATLNGGNCSLVTPNADFVPIVAGVVNIQAQYGVSATTNSNLVTQWVDASGGTWAAPTVANRNRIKAVRIAIVARNAKEEPNAVTSACSSTTAAAPTGLCAWDATSANPSIASPAPTIDLSADTKWQHYRYRVFETIIPLRNVIWSQPTL